MTPLEIKIELMKRGITMRSIALDLGVSVTAVSQVVRRGFVSQNIMRTVAEAIGKKPRQVFPEYFARKDRTIHSCQAS